MTLQLTSAGINALLRAQAGDGIIFTRIKIGNGDAQAAAIATDLSNPLKSIEITDITVSDSKASLKVIINNADVEDGFRMTEIGVFAKDQDDNEKEILYAYGTEPEGTADYIAASGDNVLEEEICIDAFVSNAENVSAIINEGLVYAKKSDLDAHTKNTENPHKVSKQQVGLGNVPNVSTNDQTPTYTEALENSELISGEKMSAAFGKIAKLIKSAIYHFSNKDNPHGVTAEQAGAAKSTHNHSANQITSGTIGVARGGTGKSSWDANKLIYPSGTTTLSQLAFPTKTNQVLHQGTSGAPYWGYARASEYGTYAGDEKSGADNMNSLTFNAFPSIVIISNIYIPGRYGLLFPGSSRGFSCVDGVYHEIKVSFDGSTIKWYYDSTDSHPEEQLNIGFYSYVGIY